VRKATVFFLHNLALLYKDNFEKNHNKKTKKKSQVGKHCSNPQYFKEKKL